MFNDKSFATTEFVSTVTSNTQTMSNATQTLEVNTKSQEVQKLEHHNSGTQTVITESHVPEVDYDKLAAFLKRITPNILEALDETAFENITAIGMSTTSKPQAKLITKFSTLDETNSQKKISDVSWSTNGGTLAISYSSLTHETWCDHLSQIKLYEFTRNDELRQNSSAIYDTIACVSCLSYHPTEPSILSAGLVNGDVILWNLTSDSITPLNVYTHDDSITSLTWRSRTIGEPTLLVTSSSDGYIMFHKLSANFTNVNLHRCYKIVKEHNPFENSRPRSAGGRRERAAEPGLSITCLDFSPKNPIIFIVGTMCGGLYKCSSEASTPIQGNDSLIDPVIDEYDRCDGSIFSVKCSLINNIFVASDTNKDIRVFNIAEASCLGIINMEYSVTGLQWIIGGNQDIIFTHGVDPVVKCFNILNETFNPKYQIECSSTNSACLDVNKKRDIVGIADSQNNLEIWKIPKLIE